MRVDGSKGLARIREWYGRRRYQRSIPPLYPRYEARIGAMIVFGFAVVLMIAGGLFGNNLGDVLGTKDTAQSEFDTPENCAPFKATDKGEYNKCRDRNWWSHRKDNATIDEPPAQVGGKVLPAQACSIKPDPTRGRGCITPRTKAMLDKLNAAGFKSPDYKISCWREDDHGDHPDGRGCDVSINGWKNEYAEGKQKENGQKLANWAVAHNAELGIHYVIWYKKEWSVKNPTWHPYNNPYGKDDANGWHGNHVHLSVY